MLSDPLRNKAKETLDHVFIHYELAFNVWSTINTHCPIPINTNLIIADWMEYIWVHKNWYHKIYENPLEKNQCNIVGHLEP